MSRTAMWTAVGLVLIGVVTFPTPAASQEADWRIASGRLVAGQALRIVLTDGSTHLGRLRTLDSSSLTIEEMGKAVIFDVIRVKEVGRRGDPLWNGPVFGALVGVAVTGAVVAVHCDGKWSSSRCPDTTKDVLLPFAAAGAGVGLLVDALRLGVGVVYRASDHAQITVVPLVATRRYGAMATLTF